MAVKWDEISYWSELKLEIIKKYATAYSTILAAQRSLEHVYVEGCAGGGVRRLRSTGEMVPGSPLNALLVKPPFREYHLVDLDPAKIESLRTLIGSRPNVHLHPGDCSQILLEKVFPTLLYENYRRGLVIVDPYGLTLRWEVMRQAGQQRTVDLFLNFPVMDMNRNVLWSRPAGVDPADVDRMNAFWGDDSWTAAAYERQPTLFGDEDLVKTGMRPVVEAFRERLKKVAGFKHVPEPMPMRNRQRAVVYYLFFASQNATADHIVKDIFGSYRNRGL